MNAVEIIRQQARMCVTCKTCIDCPLSNEMKDGSCSEYRRKNPEKVVELVEKWAKDHPEKTRKQDFLEKHPNAKLYDDKSPKACAEYLGYCNQCPIDETGCKMSCEDCWNLLFETRNE